MDKKEKKEKKEKKDAKGRDADLPVVPALDEKLPEIRINGLQCKLQFVTVYNDQAELTYVR